MTVKYNITVQNGESFSRQFKLVTASGAEFDLTSYQVDSHIRASYDDTTIAGAFTASVVQSGTFTLELSPSASAALTGSQYYYDIRITSGSNVFFPVEGKVCMSKVVTR